MSELPVLGAAWAQSLNAVIGRDGGMPWYAPEDLAHFKEITVKCPVIMGRKTWESFPEKYRPLPDRENIIVSSRVQHPTPGSGALWVPSFDQALEIAATSAKRIWLIGGAALFDDVLNREKIAGVAGNALTLVERTVFDAVIEGDTVAPDLRPNWHLESASDYRQSQRGWIQPHPGGEKKEFSFRFETWRLER